MYDAVRKLVRRVNRRGRGGRFLDYAVTAGHVIITTILVIASVAKLPM